jgi:hypothetical protein
MRLKYLFLLCTICVSVRGISQSRFEKWWNPVIDSAYVDNYYNDLIIRLFSSQKYSNQTIGDREQKSKLVYKPSNGYTVGAGFTYKFLTVNLGVAFPFTTPDPKIYGKTERLDLQFHVYLKRLYLDFFSGYYKGQYLENSGDHFPSAIRNEWYYVRNDIRTYSAGAGIYTNFNPKKFRFEAPFLQNVKQKKSAGAPTAGYEVFWVGSQADSSFVPSGMTGNGFFQGRHFNRWEIITFNLTGGYAYNFVIGKNFFLLLSLNGSIGLGYNHLHEVSAGKESRFSANKGINHRAGVGYHYNRFFVGASWVGYHLIGPTPVPNTYIYWSPGNLRFNVAYRFTLKREISLLGL